MYNIWLGTRADITKSNVSTRQILKTHKDVHCKQMNIGRKPYKLTLTNLLQASRHYRMSKLVLC